MNKKYKVGIVGATGMVGQRFALLLENHPWFEVVCLAASARSAGKPYKEALGSRWCMDKPIPANMADLPVYDAQADIEKITSMVDFVFCAVDMKKDEIRALEEQYAKHECPVVSNNSANRFTPDVPMVVPELNPQHIDIIPAQRKRLGTKRGFIAVKSNCSLQSYVPAIFPLHLKYGIKRVLVCTYQGIEMILKGYMEIRDHGQEARIPLMKDFLMAANYAGIAFGNAGCAAVHALSYPLGAKYHVAHGESNYAMFTGVLNNYMEIKSDGEIARLNKFMAEILGCDVDVVYAELEKLLNVMIPKKALHEYGVTEAELEEFTDSVLENQGRLMANNFVELDRERVYKIYRECF